jgi:hypothetical protein
MEEGPTCGLGMLVQQEVVAILGAIKVDCGLRFGDTNIGLQIWGNVQN